MLMNCESDLENAHGCNGLYPRRIIFDQSAKMFLWLGINLEDVEVDVPKILWLRGSPFADAWLTTYFALCHCPLIWVWVYLSCNYVSCWMNIVSTDQLICDASVCRKKTVDSLCNRMDQSSIRALTISMSQAFNEDLFGSGV